jgi:hypothetical protein
MATFILSHDVKDYATWKPLYDADSARRNEAGLKELAVGTQSDNPNKVYIIWEGETATVDQMMKDPDMEEKMKEAGVTSAPEITIINS